MIQAPLLRDLLTTAVMRVPDRCEVELLLMHALGVDRAWLFAHATDTVDTAAAVRFEALLARREQGEPVAYILARRGFWSLDLEVTPATLIPRPETECLVELALHRIPEGAAVSVADLGTGSGAIALALASERPQAQIVATDISSAALAVARRNAVAHGLEHITFLQGAWCQPLLGRRFDVMVSNPPYIGHDDAHLQQGDLRHEPRAALVSGTDGLEAIRTIASQATEYLLEHGCLLLEHGCQQGDAVREILSAAGFVDVFTTTDLESRDRVSGARARMRK